MSFGRTLKGRKLGVVLATTVALLVTGCGSQPSDEQVCRWVKAYGDGLSGGDAKSAESARAKLQSLADQRPGTVSDELYQAVARFSSASQDGNTSATTAGLQKMVDACSQLGYSVR